MSFVPKQLTIPPMPPVKKLDHSDLISRRHLIYSLEKDGLPVSAWLRDMIESEPSAEPERKTGKWIDYTEDGYVECPYCHSATNCDGNKDELHYCYSCGAELR